MCAAAWPAVALCQTAVPDPTANETQVQSAAPATATPAVQALLAFKDSDIKFSVADMMDILRDKRHEGWVLAAYPDPKTSQPLIGAGFSIDLPARDHPQRDPLNPNLFYEPSSAELWQAAGLDQAKLASILDQFHSQLDAWGARGFRRDIRYLPAQITDEDADKLLRIAIVQSIVNARAYCRNFDRLTAHQQMALSQLVYQMGVNLEEFTEFRVLINDGFEKFASAEDGTNAPQFREAVLRTSTVNAEYWRTVQQSLTHSQWARLYRARAVAVVAMLDPQYAKNPVLAERRVSAVIRPVRSSRSRSSLQASTELASAHSTRPRSGRSKSRLHAAKKKTA
jgi:hypothetical protein